LYAIFEQFAIEMPKNFHMNLDGFYKDSGKTCHDRQLRPLEDSGETVVKVPILLKLPIDFIPLKLYSTKSLKLFTRQGEGHAL